MPSEFPMSRRQQALAKDLSEADGPRVSLDPPESNKAALNDEQVAASCARVFVWVLTGAEPGGGAADDGWFAVAQLLRTMFAGDAEPPAIHTDQLIDLIRAAHGRALRMPATGTVRELAPGLYTAWRAVARHGYNCVIAEREALRDTPLDERERMMVRFAVDALNGVPPPEEATGPMTTEPPTVERRQTRTPTPTPNPPAVQTVELPAQSPFVFTYFPG